MKRNDAGSKECTTIEKVKMILLAIVITFIGSIDSINF